MDELRAADNLRDTDPPAALAAYERLQEHIASRGDDRLDWILIQKPYREGLLPLYERVYEENEAGSLRANAGLALAGLSLDLCDLECAERVYIQVLKDSRVLADRTWLTACINLAQTYRLAGRTFEALVLARRGAAEAQARADDEALVVAYLHMSGLSSDLRDARRLAESLSLMQYALDVAGDNCRREILSCLVLGYRAELKELSGRTEDALADLAEFERIRPEGPRSDEYQAESWVHQARMNLTLGRAEKARELLDRVRDGGWDQPYIVVARACAEVSYATAVEGPEAGRLAGLACLALLREYGARIGEGTLMRHAAELGRILWQSCGALAEARRAFDTAARAAQCLVAEVDRCMRELPEMAGATSEEMEILAEYRERFAAEHRELRHSADNAAAASIS